MKISKILISVGAFLLIAIVGFYGYMGGFHSVAVNESDFQATDIIFKTHRGPYEGLSASWSKFAQEFQEAGLEDCNAMGIYLDPPSTPPEQLRTIMACQLGGLPEELQTKLKESFKSFQLPAAKTFTSRFPYVNEFSFWFAPMKVYPSFQNMIATNVIRPSVAIETYGLDAARKEIVFHMPSQMKVEDYQPLVEAFL